MSVTPAQKLELPVSEYKVEGYHFGQRVRSRLILWARHLGDDVVLQPGTEVRAIAPGRVVWAEVRPGNEVRRNWGGIVVIEHTHKATEHTFYSLYGHMRDISVKAGQEVFAGALVGKVAPGSSPENGWWKVPHLHFAVYVGPWMDAVLPGYKRFFENRTRLSWWKDPRRFIEEYNRLS